MGFQLRKVQKGEEPDDWKPMTEIGPGCREIRVRTEDGQHRSLYVVGGNPRGVYVLAAFAKKTQKTPDSVKKLARKRFHAAHQHMKGQKP